MSEPIEKPERMYAALSIHPPSSQRDTAIHLGLSHLLAGAGALGISAWLAYLHVQPISTLLFALAAAVICGFLCTLPLQYSLYLLELTLARLAQHPLPSDWDEYIDTPSFARRWPLDSLFQRAQEIEQRVRRSRTNERLMAEVREHALQQAREAAALAERNRIARELHDSIKQHLFGINASAAAARAHWQRANENGAREAVLEIERSAHGAQVEMQALLQQLRPAPLEQTSLLEALRTQAQALGVRTSAEVRVDLAPLPQQDRLLPGTQEAIFRLVQEAFANIARHARARTVWLTLQTVGQSIRITVRDDGQGFDPAQARTGMGLANLRERTQALHGSLEIHSQRGAGTIVLISIPLLEALPSPRDAARQQYELARADELARRSYRLCTNAAFLATALGMVGVINGWNALSLSVLAGLLVTLYSFARGGYYRARVAASTSGESRDALELAQKHYSAGLSMLLPASLGVFYLFKLAGSLGATPALWLFIGLALCLGGPIQFVLWRYTHETARYFSRLSTQELSTELDRRQQWFIRALLIWGMIGAAGLIFGHALFVLPPVTPAQLNAYSTALNMLLVGISLLWNARLIQGGKRQLRQRTTDQSDQAQEGADG